MKSILFSGLSIFILCFFPSCDDIENNNNVKCPGPEACILENDCRTIIAPYNAQAGDTLIVEGEKYLVVDKEMLREMVFTDQDVTKVITSLVTDLQLLFDGKTYFNQDISRWDVSNVEYMNVMFGWADEELKSCVFDRDISCWDVSKVVDMSGAFAGAFYFNQPIGSWDVSKVKVMTAMFLGAARFNQDLSNWDVSQVELMGQMFRGATSFNQPLELWDVGNVTNFGEMFYEAGSFNQPLNTWNVSNANHMSYMFCGASSFNQDLSSWDVQNVTQMNLMFSSYLIDGSIVPMSYNQDLSSWSVGKVNKCSKFAYMTDSWVLPKPDFILCDPN